MSIPAVKRPADCSILIVDDDVTVCTLLQEALRPIYRRVVTSHRARAAFGEIDRAEFDVVVTDLKLPDGSGIEVLRRAKDKDQYAEVIIVTGFASVETAAEAINLGVTSYLTKPLSLDDFLIQIEKAAATRIFHLKSLLLMSQSDVTFPEIKSHVHDITALYYFSRKLMLSLEISEMMRIILEEANRRMGALFCGIGIHFLGFSEAYIMPQVGRMDEEAGRETLMRQWIEVFGHESVTSVEGIAFTAFKGKTGVASGERHGEVAVVPLNVLGQTIGFLLIALPEGRPADGERNQYLYVFTSMITSMIEHGYLDMQAKKQAKTDSLTGIANHRMFHETIEREIARADRSGNSFCLALIDIDDFKKVNDTYGHLVGDAVLVDLSRRVNGMIRKQDVLARYGGEEFALVLPDTDLTGARILAERVCALIAEQSLEFSQKAVSYTVSIGLAAYASEGKIRKDELIHQADMALYASKHSGKNRVSITTGERS